MFSCVILAAGMGTRMKSSMPKVIHKVCGKELVCRVIGSAKAAGADRVLTVVGHKADAVKAAVGDECEFALQAEQKGTGHAVMQAADFIRGAGGNVVILNGDTPLITSDTIKKAVEYHNKNAYSATVITAVLCDATGYGRIIRDQNGGVLKIVEHKDATDEERKIKEINSGMYVFNADELLKALDKLEPNNAQGEYYLTDTLEILLSAGKKVGAYTIEDNDEIRGINDRVQLWEAEKIMQKRINERHMRNGVTIHMPETVMIEDNVKIGADVEIGANVSIKGNSVIETGTVINDGSIIENSVIHSGVNVLKSVILDSEIDSGTNVGPFAYVRPNCKVGKNVKVGDFVELKNTNIGDGTKISHLTYLGDSDIGGNVNFGCGTVTCNYDGKNKYRTVIGDNCFVGCNTNFVAPVNVGNGAYIAAGSTITEDIPDDSLSIARARQVNKDGWSDKRK